MWFRAKLSNIIELSSHQRVTPNSTPEKNAVLTKRLKRLPTNRRRHQRQLATQSQTPSGAIGAAKNALAFFGNEKKLGQSSELLISREAAVVAAAAAAVPATRGWNGQSKWVNGGNRAKREKLLRLYLIVVVVVAAVPLLLSALLLLGRIRVSLSFSCAADYGLFLLFFVCVGCNDLFSLLPVMQSDKGECDLNDTINWKMNNNNYSFVFYLCFRLECALRIL